MLTNRTFNRLCKISGLLVSTVLLLNGVQTARAFTSVDQAQAFGAWTNAFYYTSGGRGYFRVQEGTGNNEYFWQWAYDIDVIVRAQKIGLASTDMVNQACAGFTNTYGTDWSWNVWNDDLGAVARMFIDAYEVTGNTLWRDRARYAFDLSYNRGLDPVTGGMFETTTNGPAHIVATETTAPALIVAYQLGIAFSDPSYTAKAQGLYTHLTNYIIDRATGMVRGTPGGGTSAAPADYGYVMVCANLMGDTNIALKVNNYLTNHWGILMTGSGGGASFLGLYGMGELGLNNDFANRVCDNAWSWRNSRGLVLEWDHRASDSTVVNCWESMQLPLAMIAVVPKVPPTLPVTAADVVGGQVTFTAAFPGGWSYQWQKISGGVTNNIAGATSTALTLNNVQLNDTATYQCRATNGLTVQVSTPAKLTVSNVSAPINNVIASYAAQTGPGYGSPFTPTWSVTANSLLAGLTPSTANGNFNLEAYYAARNVNSLTAGGSLTVSPQGPNYPFPAFVYQSFTNTFVARAATETLSFIGLDPYGPGIAEGQTVFIDDVAIVSAGGAPVTVQDPGFETPSLGAGNFQYNPSGSPWTFSGGSPSGAGILANGSAFEATNAPQGVQAALVQGRGVLRQNITGLTPGMAYTISYKTTQRNHEGYQEQWWLVTMGNVATPAGSAANSYTNYSLTFTATASSQTVAFVGTDFANNGNTVFIDNVSIVATNGTPVTVANASFESPVLGTGNFQYNPAGGSWTFSGSSPNGSGIVANGSGFGNPSSPNGVQAAFVQGKSMITQTISGFAPGMVYTISFNAAQRTDFNAGGETWDATVNGTVIGSSATVLGSRVITGNNYVTCGNSGLAGTNLVYTLPASASGYNLTNITVYGGWADNERDDQAYTVYYSTVSAPSTFNLLGTVNYNPVNTNRNPSYESSGYATVGAQSATRATLKAATGVLASNVVALKFDFTTPASENGYAGYVQIAAYGASVAPKLISDTLPAAAVDVVGSEVTFAATIDSFDPITCQWQKISGGVTNDIVGATNATLTLSSLQLGDAASYRLRATNAFGVAYSTPRPLTVNSVPGAVNNIITSYAAQTGLGGSANDFSTTWTVIPGSLIAGMAPSSVGAGNFSDPFANECGTVAVLTDGSFGYLHSVPGNGGGPTEVACGTVVGGAGQSVTYTLTNSTSGYTLTNIVVYGGWGDAGRDQQAYTVYYSTVAAPTTFIQLSSANYNPVNPSGVHSATRAMFMPVNGVLATNVAAVKFDFTTPAPENGYCGYSEIDLYGTPTFVTATNPTNLTMQVTANSLTLSWPNDHIGWRLQVQTNSLTQGLGTNWADVAGATLTNQMTMTVNPASHAVFFRLVSP